MKKKLISSAGFVVLLVAAIFSFSLAGCDNPSSAPLSDPALSGTIVISASPGGTAATTATTGATLYAVYSGTETVTCQWYKDGTAISGATGGSYTPSATGSYAVTVRAIGYQSKDSDPVTVSPGSVPELSGSIVISTTAGGAAVATATTGATLYAVYSGTETVVYQWKKDGTAISGATGGSYTPSAPGSYTVTVSSSGYQSKDSNPVTVSPGSVPELSGSIVISATDGGTAATTAETGATLYAVYSGSESVAYQWKKDGVNVTTGGTGGNYTPATAGIYTVTVSATGYQSKDSNPVTVTPAGVPELSGSIVISATAGGAAATTAETGATLYAVYSGTETVAYQWKKDGANVATGGTGGRYTPGEEGSYTVTVSAAGYQSKDSGIVTVSVPALSGTIIIAGTADWTNTLSRISADSDGTESDPKVYTLDIQGVVPVQDAQVSNINGEYKTVRLTGSGTLSLSGRGVLFRVGNSNQTLIIDGPTLSGIAGNNLPLVNTGVGTVELSNGTITGNTVSSGGGGVYVAGGTFTMNGGTISGNTSSADSSSGGGGVYISSGTFTMNGGAISDNTVSTNSSAPSYIGGGVYVGRGGTFTMTGGVISGNTAYSPSNTSSKRGGGVYVTREGTFAMSGGDISGNTSGGGGVYVDISATFTMSEGTISDNISPGVFTDGTFTMSGGTISDNSDRGVYVHSGTFTMQDGIISGNTGSGVDIQYGTFAMPGGTISGNSDRGVYNRGTFTMQDGTISGNTGNGVYNSGTFTMSEGTISNNTGSGARIGGGTFTLQDGTISGNTASNGGGVYVDGSGAFTMQDGTVSGNTASDDGGGVYVNGTFTMSGGTISDNTASGGNGGGGVYVYGRGTFTMPGGTISGNTASSGGGVHIYGDGTFIKTGGTVYGDFPESTTTPQTSGPNANTAIDASNIGKSGHAVFYRLGISSSALIYYRNETLADDANGKISTTDEFPSTIYNVRNNWRKR